jgi:hypothetical protein
MSVFEPHKAAESPSGKRPFQRLQRGYARHQVDAVVNELSEQLDQERQRADEVTRALQDLQRESRKQQRAPSFVDLGAEAAKVLEQAGTAAEDLLAEAELRAQAIAEAAEAKAEARIRAAERLAEEHEETARQTLAEARAERSRLETEAADAVEQARAQAEVEAKSLVTEAFNDARLSWQKTERERLLIEGENERIQALHHVTVEQLRRVRTHLGLALLEAEVDLEDEGEAGADAGPEAGEAPEPEQPEQVEPAAGAASAEREDDELPEAEAEQPAETGAR